MFVSASSGKRSSVINVWHASRARLCRVGGYCQFSGSCISLTVVLPCSVCVWAVCLPEGGTSPAQTDPIGLLWRLCSQTDLRPESGNLIHLRRVLQFQSQHGRSARPERWRKLRCNRKRGTVGFHHQLGWLIAQLCQLIAEFLKGSTFKFKDFNTSCIGN